MKKNGQILQPTNRLIISITIIVVITCNSICIVRLMIRKLNCEDILSRNHGFM